MYISERDKKIWKNQKDESFQYLYPASVYIFSEKQKEIKIILNIKYRDQGLDLTLMHFFIVSVLLPERALKGLDHIRKWAFSWFTSLLLHLIIGFL